MKINWGTGIAIFYTLFVIILVGIVIKSASTGVDLVEKDYYQKDINYEEFRLKKQEYKELENKVEFKYLAKSKQLQIKFPNELENVIGVITLFRPSNGKLDQSYPLDLNNENTMNIDTKKMLKGRWKIKTEYNSNGKEFYHELDLTI